MNIQSIVAKVESDHRWTGNILQKLAEEVVRYTIPIEEIIKIDLSFKLLKELEREVINKEIISLQINAKPRMAKSTLAILLGTFIDSLLKKHGFKNKNIPFDISNIARDQNERAKKMRDPDLMHEIIITDESNAMEDTGENATVEKAQREVFSDIQAGRYVHGIWVCPEGTMDKNSDIKLEIRNKDKGFIHTRVHYYMKSSLYYGWVLIGIADFDVRELIKLWLRVEPRFFDYLRNRKEKDKKYIDYWSNKDFYVNYMCRKYEKMELMNREGILHARDLDYADIRKAVIDSLKPLASLSFISMSRLHNNIKTKVEFEFKKRKMPMSLIGRGLEFERVSTFLDMYRSLTEIKENINRIIVKLKKRQINQDEFNQTMKVLQHAKQELEDQINVSEEALDRLVVLSKKYNKEVK